MTHELALVPQSAASARVLQQLRQELPERMRAGAPDGRDQAAPGNKGEEQLSRGVGVHAGVAMRGATIRACRQCPRVSVCDVAVTLHDRAFRGH